ncbi:MAG: hypothetical protein KKA65_02625 [Nanoarchaeota archaeon]|nr:hypothetical protein [Nanoarchaeota archaeon]MBU4242429.1 hypothetical protein [Nanoarchaeota archaeon]MBU4352623.1 hypothetical protein [Nanoarchaeota archaeon]MBU4456372.1 hypothetical protein [Nanoarchaeota archaeon]MCG2719651.1 hypothetical protein [Nanoarchaeota archaeon]
MKKSILVIFVVLLMSSLTFAQGQQGIHEPGTGIENPEVKEAGQGTGQGLEAQEMQGEAQQVMAQNKAQNKVMAGEFMSENGKQMKFQVQENNQLKFQVGNAFANTNMELMQEQVQEKTRLKVKLSNGKDSEIKIMPDTASERALERLKLKVCAEENGCHIELKEVGQGEQVRVAYEVQAQKQARFLGLFKTQMQVQAQVDAENGEIIQSQKPWWAFLASESEE